jgi:hypothetical protein
MPPVIKSITHTKATGVHHELQIYCFTRTGHDSVGLFYRQRASGARLRSGRMAECLGPMPLCRSRYCSIARRLCGACSSRFELCLPSRILAWAMGTLPQHAVSWSPAERDVSMMHRARREANAHSADEFISHGCGCPSASAAAFVRPTYHCFEVRISASRLRATGERLPFTYTG